MTESQLTRILYVEDDPDIQVVARMSLEKLGGFTVKVCNSGQKALEEAQQFRPDLILLDVMMPDMDGPATLQSLRKLAGLEEIPFVFLTAKTQKKETDSFKRLGALGVIAKPFDPLQLHQSLRELWDQR